MTTTSPAVTAIRDALAREQLELLEADALASAAFQAYRAAYERLAVLHVTVASLEASLASLETTPEADPLEQSGIVTVAEMRALSADEPEGAA